MSNFNVHDYGAFGDGLHDDRKAINAAFAAAKQAGGRQHVEFPKGTYVLGMETLDVADVDIRSVDEDER